MEGWKIIRLMIRVSDSVSVSEISSAQTYSNIWVGATLVAHGEAEALPTRGVSCAMIYVVVYKFKIGDPSIPDIYYPVHDAGFIDHRVVTCD